MFVREQQEYLKEEIKWEYIDFGSDMQNTIELIEKVISSVLINSKKKIKKIHK